MCWSNSLRYGPTRPRQSEPAPRKPPARTHADRRWFAAPRLLFRAALSRPDAGRNRPRSSFGGRETHVSSTRVTALKRYTLVPNSVYRFNTPRAVRNSSVFLGQGSSLPFVSAASKSAGLIRRSVRYPCRAVGVLRAGAGSKKRKQDRRTDAQSRCHHRTKHVLSNHPPVYLARGTSELHVPRILRNTHSRLS